VRITQMRKSIAKRLTAVHTTAPTFFLTAVLECDNLVQLRTQLVAAGMKVSYNDILIKACAKALAESPQVNASWGDDGITRYGLGARRRRGRARRRAHHAGREGRGSRKRSTRLPARCASSRERARAMKLQPDEYTGSTFTISNLGMMGIEHFTAILNPPEACILAVGALTKEPVVAENGIGGGAQPDACDAHLRSPRRRRRDRRRSSSRSCARYVENPVLCLM
jgi:pyruvate dehydrogenase E2 component (dihydrolipoamide acetyltransferase)